MSLLVLPVEFFVLPPQRWPDNLVNPVLSVANRIWSQADIHCMRMAVHRPAISDLRLPQGSTLDPLNARANLHLFNTVHGQRLGLRVFLTPSGFAEDKNTAGAARRDTNFCAVRLVHDAAWTGTVLAHELGHCFNLADLNLEGNLMHGSVHGRGSARPLGLEQRQIDNARASSVVRRFSF